MIKFLKKLFQGNGVKKLLEVKEEITIGIRGKLVIMDFHRTIKYLSMDAQTAVKMGRALTSRGQECLKVGGSSVGKK